MDASKRLKQETLFQHKQVDNHSLMKRVVAKDLCVLEYQRILQALQLWLVQLQPALDSLDLDKNFATQKKREHILTDLKNLCVDQSTKDLLAGFVPLKNVTNSSSMGGLSRAFCLGIHYVVEGSTLGAQFIAPRVEQSLNRDDVTHFYRAYGVAVMSHWQHTQHILNTELITDEEQQLSVCGAQTAFNLMLEILEPVSCKASLRLEQAL